MSHKAEVEKAAELWRPVIEETKKMADTAGPLIVVSNPLPAWYRAHLENTAYELIRGLALPPEMMSIGPSD